MAPVKFPTIKVKLLGESGNAFYIMGKVVRELKRNKVSDSDIDEFMTKCKSGDYDNLLRTVLETVEVE